MVLFHKTSPKASKHPHNPQLIFAMGIASARIKDDVFDSTFASYSSSALVSAPQIAVDNDGGDTLPVIQVLFSYESGYCFCGCFFY